MNSGLNGIKFYKSDLVNMAFETESIVENEEIPFPQADNFMKIIQLLSNLKEKDMKKDEVTKLLGYTTRQTDYYTNSAIYLGLIEKMHIKNGTYFSLTESGRKICSLPPEEMFLNIIKTIFKHSVFKRVFLESIDDESIMKDRVLEIMIEENLKITSDSTLYRRAKTITSWIEWIYSLMK